MSDQRDDLNQAMEDLLKSQVEVTETARKVNHALEIADAGAVAVARQHIRAVAYAIRQGINAEALQRLADRAPAWRARRTGERPAGTHASRRPWHTTGLHPRRTR